MHVGCAADFFACSTLLRGGRWDTRSCSACLSSTNVKSFPLLFVITRAKHVEFCSAQQEVDHACWLRSRFFWLHKALKGGAFGRTFFSSHDLGTATSPRHLSEIRSKNHFSSDLDHRGQSWRSAPKSPKPGSSRGHFAMQRRKGQASGGSGCVRSFDSAKAVKSLKPLG